MINEKIKFGDITITSDTPNEEKFSKTTNFSKSSDFCGIRESLRSARANSKNRENISIVGGINLNTSGNLNLSGISRIREINKVNPYFSNLNIGNMS